MNTALQNMLAQMQPVLHDGAYAYCCIPEEQAGAHVANAIALMRESEGMTVILTVERAEELGFQIHLRCAWITLQLHSDLAAFGLTAAFARALADANISCNVIAGCFHDHIFVPFDDKDRAFTALKRLSQSVE
jgi:uncharacterized protein